MSWSALELIQPSQRPLTRPQPRVTAEGEGESLPRPRPNWRSPERRHAQSEVALKAACIEG